MRKKPAKFIFHYEKTSQQVQCSKDLNYRLNYINIDIKFEYLT